MAPEQAFFLRENLKLRLLNARLALLSRQFDTAQSDLRDAQAALDRYFDRSSRRVVAASELVRQVAAQARQVSAAAARRHAGGPRRRLGRPLNGAGRSAMRSVIWLVLLFVVAVVAATTLGTQRRPGQLYWRRLAHRPVAEPVRAAGRWPPASCWCRRRRRSTRWSACRGARASGARCAASAPPRRRCARRWPSTSARATAARTRRRSARWRCADDTPALARRRRVPRARPPAGRRQPAPPAGPHAAATSTLQPRAARLRAAAAAARIGRRRRAAAGRRMGAGRPRRAARAGAAGRAAARRGAPHAGAAAEAAGRAPGAAAAGGAADGAPAGQAPGLLARRRRRACCARWPSRRWRARTTCEQLRRVWQQLDAADRRDPHGRRARRAARRRSSAPPKTRGSWLRPFWDRLAELARDDRERGGAGADRGAPRHRRRLAAAPGERARRPTATSGAWSPRWAWRWPSASSGARRGACWSRPPPTPGLPPRARRRAWRQLAALAREEADEARARACERAAAAID